MAKGSVSVVLHSPHSRTGRRPSREQAQSSTQHHRHDSTGDALLDQHHEGYERVLVVYRGEVLRSASSKHVGPDKDITVEDLEDVFNSGKAMIVDTLTKPRIDIALVADLSSDGRITQGALARMASAALTAPVAFHFSAKGSCQTQSFISAMDVLTKAYDLDRYSHVLFTRFDAELLSSVDAKWMRTNLVAPFYQTRRKTKQPEMNDIIFALPTSRFEELRVAVGILSRSRDKFDYNSLHRLDMPGTEFLTNKSIDANTTKEWNPYYTLKGRNSKKPPWPTAPTHGKRAQPASPPGGAAQPASSSRGAAQPTFSALPPTCSAAQPATSSNVVLRPATPRINAIFGSDASGKAALQEVLEKIRRAFLFGRLLTQTSPRTSLNITQKLEEFLRVVEEQRAKHLRRTPGLHSDAIFSNSDMKKIHSEWMNDYRSWMNAETVQEYERSLVGGGALRRRSFSAYLFQIIGNKQMVLSCIQYPWRSPDAIRRFMDAWEQEKSTAVLDSPPRHQVVLHSPPRGLPNRRGRRARSRSRTRRQ